MLKTQTSLRLYEALLLLALKDEQGTLEGMSIHMHIVLGSGILAELLLHNRVVVEPTRWSKKLVVVDASPLNDPILDESLKMVASAKREASPSHWISKFGYVKKLHDRIAQQLADKGILRSETIKLLGLFPKQVYPELDPKPEMKVIEQLHNAIFNVGVGIDQRTIALLAIAYSTELLRFSFEKRELKARKQHIKQLIEDDAAADAVKACVDATNAALLAVMVVVVT